MGLLGYRANDPIVAADCCGVRWHRSRCVMKYGRYYCPDHKHVIPAEQLDRENARIRPIGVRPVKNPRVVVQDGIYQEAVGQMVNYIIDNASTIQDIAEGVRALYDIANDVKRPKATVDRATAGISTLADLLLAYQFGTTYVAASTLTHHGAFATSDLAVGNTTFYSEHVAEGGYALVLAYNTTGNRKYLEGAKKAALCLRRMQCGDLKTTNFSSTSSAGSTRKKIGMWVHSFVVAASSGGGPS